MSFFKFIPVRIVRLPKRVTAAMLITCFFLLALGVAGITAPARAYAQTTSGISVNIELKKTTIKIGKELKIKAVITQNGKKLEDIEVKFDVTDSNGSIVNSIVAITNSRGKAKAVIPTSNLIANSTYSILVSVNTGQWEPLGVASFTTKSAVSGKSKVVGSPQFIANIEAALALLAAKDSAVYAQYSKVKKILELPLQYQNIYGGMAEGRTVWINPDPTYSIEEIAIILSHEFNHVINRHLDVPIVVLERLAVTQELSTAVAIGAPYWLIEWSSWILANLDDPSTWWWSLLVAKSGEIIFVD
ncbi:MAG: hypothetical protein M1371_04025 [Actinobacteria bacterium]|nr:hypothetical protein [Actinomycetota bacterium]